MIIGTACVDCAMILANDDDSGMTTEQAERSRAGIAAERAEGYQIVVDGDPFFSKAPCLICRETLNGDRYETVYLKV